MVDSALVYVSQNHTWGCPAGRYRARFRPHARHPTQARTNRSRPNGVLCTHASNGERPPASKHDIALADVLQVIAIAVREYPVRFLNRSNVNDIDCCRFRVKLPAVNRNHGRHASPTSAKPLTRSSQGGAASFPFAADDIRSHRQR